MAILLFWEKDQFEPASPLRGSADLSYKGWDSRGFRPRGRAHGGRELCGVRAALDEASSHSPTVPSGATVSRASRKRLQRAKAAGEGAAAGANPVFAGVRGSPVPGESGGWGRGK